MADNGSGTDELFHVEPPPPDADTAQRLQLLEELRALSGAELATAVLELIEDNIDRWGQDNWRHNGATEEERYEANRHDPLNPQCRTSFCVAGWIGAIDGVRWGESVEFIGHPVRCNCTTPRCLVSHHLTHISDYAAGRLGLQTESASRLFNGDNTLEELQEMVGVMASGGSVFDVHLDRDADETDDYEASYEDDDDDDDD